MAKKTLSIGVGVITAAVLLFAAQSFAGFLFKYDKVEAVKGEIFIPLESVDDGEAHYFVYEDGNRDVKFFVVKSVDGVIRAAFDACDVCYREKKGYSQAGEFMVCNNCGRKFHSSRINVVKGGCNPAPLKRVERDGHLVIRQSDVALGARFF